MVEFALILPVLLVLVFGVVDLGRLIYDQSLINEAVRDGARYAITKHTDTCGAGSACGTQAVVQAAAGSVGSSLTVCSAYLYSSNLLAAAPSCPNSNTTSDKYGYVTVVASLPFSPATGLFGSNWTITLQAQSTMLFTTAD